MRGTLDTAGALTEDESLMYRLNVMGENGDTYRDHVDSKRWNIAPVIQWSPSDTNKVTLEADLLRNQHALDRGFTRYEGQKDIILTRQSTGGKLARTGIAYIMIMTCYSCVLNIPLTMTGHLILVLNI